MRRDEASLLDIAAAARRVAEFVAGMDKAAFLSDAKTQSAVLHQLTIIGEAAKRLSVEFRLLHSSLPWPLIIGMRNKLVHEYDDVDLEEVWKTAITDVPATLTRIQPLLPRGEPGHGK